MAAIHLKKAETGQQKSGKVVINKEEREGHFAT